MSQGVFISATYDLDAGGALPARVQPETINTFNPDGSNTVVPGVGRIRLSAGRRAFGVKPRTVTGVWTTAPANYKAAGTVRIPIMTPAAYQAIDLNDSLTYLGGTFRVTGKNPEKES